jgi:hypothetical protein
MLVVSGENGTGFLNTEFAEGTEKSKTKTRFRDPRGRESSA